MTMAGSKDGIGGPMATGSSGPNTDGDGDNVRGNFAMGTWFGEVTCVHGHPVRLFNIGRGHWVACDTCRTYIHVGSNLMSCWRQENNDIWEKNWQSIAGYQEVEWGTPGRTSPP